MTDEQKHARQQDADDAHHSSTQAPPDRKEPSPPGQGRAHSIESPGSAHADRIRTGIGGAANREPEQEVWSGRTSLKHYAGRIALWLLANIAAAVLIGILASTIERFTKTHVFWIVVVLVLASGAWIIGGILLSIIGCHYRLTTERLFIERGIFSRTIDQTELIRVDDVRMRKSLFDRLFGLGTVTIVSTDSTDADLEVQGISEPESVAEAIRTQMRSLRRGSLYVENL